MVISERSSLESASSPLVAGGSIGSVIAWEYVIVSARAEEDLARRKGSHVPQCSSRKEYG
jgi:hypothetical protein